MLQDPSQNVVSSNCMTLTKAGGSEGNDLHISCTMPSLEVGTVGGGTSLPAQSAALDILGISGPCFEEPGRNAKELAMIISGAVLAAELSILSDLAAGKLVDSHMRLNRSGISANAATQATTPPASPKPESSTTQDK